MQLNNEAGMEDWHDFELGSRREVIALLRQLGERNQSIRMLIRGQADVCVTTLLNIDAGAGLVVLDVPVDREQHQRALEASQIRFETTLDKIRILFSAEGLSATTYENRAALQMDLPETMIRLQRRDYYRMPTPVTNPVRVTIPRPPELGGGLLHFPLVDISCGGICLFDTHHELSNTIGTNYQLCRIDLPDGSPVTTTLQVRNSLDATLFNNKTQRRIGCAFVNMPRAGMAAVQRYITHLERERNARNAGLA